MKIKTFVGQQFLSITEEEKQYLLSEIKNGLSKFNLSESSIKFEDSDICPSFVISMFDKKTNYRDRNNNLINPQYIRVKFTSQNGYDEAEVGKCYEWTEGFKPELNKHSYSLGIDIIGHARNYRARTVLHNVGLTQTTYTYGTELSDLETESGFNKLSKFISSMQQCSTNII